MQPREKNEAKDVRIVGENTRHMPVMRDDCVALDGFSISHLGFCDAATPYKVVRPQLVGAFFLATVSGRGKMLLDGRWRTHEPGFASFAPKNSVLAFNAIEGERWSFCWVKFSDEAAISAKNAIAPLYGQFGSEALMHAILGLRAEVARADNVHFDGLWLKLVSDYVRRFAVPDRMYGRIYATFQMVQEDLAHPWSVDELADHSNMSSEHLRRVCHKLLGRTPMQHVTFLRIRHAAHLLTTTNEKLEFVALAVGYQSSFGLSNTFKKFTGFRPSELRNRQDVDIYTHP